MAKHQTSAVSKISVRKTKKGLSNTLFLIAGLFVGGLMEQYLMSKVAFLADTKTDAAGATTKNTVGVFLKSAAYIIGGTIPAQLSSNEMIANIGYGISAYGGLKAAKALSDSAKVYGLSGLTHYRDPQLPLPTYSLPEMVAVSSR
jgi:hypothetical protein